MSWGNVVTVSCAGLWWSAPQPSRQPTRKFGWWERGKAGEGYGWLASICEEAGRRPPSIRSCPQVFDGTLVAAAAKAIPARRVKSNLPPAPIVMLLLTQRLRSGRRLELKVWGSESGEREREMGGGLVVVKGLAVGRCQVGHRFNSGVARLPRRRRAIRPPAALRPRPSISSPEGIPSIKPRRSTIAFHSPPAAG